MTEDAVQEELPLEPQVTEQPAEAEPPEPAAEPAEEQDERDKRIARLAHENRENRRKARQLQQELEQLRQRPQDTPDAEMDRKVQERAVALAVVAAFNERCNAIFDSGVKQYGDGFKDAVNVVNEGFGKHMPAQFVESCVEAGDPAQLINYLGQNPDELDDIAQLPAHRQGAALAKLATKLSAKPSPKAVSKAPPPIRPVSGNSKGSVDPDKMTIAEYMAYEDERWQKRKRGILQ